MMCVSKDSRYLKNQQNFFNFKICVKYFILLLIYTKPIINANYVIN